MIAPVQKRPEGVWIVPRQDAAAVLAEVKAMTDEQLREALAQGLRVSVESLLRCALILRELERRGQKVLGVDEGLLAVLRRIAAGELLAEVVVRFAGAPEVLGRVGKLSVEEQRATVEDEDKVRELLRPKPRAKAVPQRQRIKGRLPEEAVNPILAAETATAKDLADMVAEMILRHPDPAGVLRLVLADPRIRKVSA